MSAFLTKDEDIRKSSIYIGKIILSKLDKNPENKISMLDVYKHLEKNNVTSYRQMLFAILFLYSCDLIDFNSSYIEKK